MKRFAAWAFGAALLAGSTQAAATGFTDIGDDLRSHVRSMFDLHGQFRLRGEMFYNLDLDRGPTPSGQLLFPVPLSDPKGQSLYAADFRFRADLAVYAPGGGVAAKVRLDVPDNLALGAFPEGVPSASTSQKSPEFVASLKRAYMEVLTPVGVFAGGRMGNTWGLGMLANGGDCADCDSGDSADRIAFITPVAGHVWAVAFDFSGSGPFVPRGVQNRVIEVDASDDVRSLTFAVLNFKNDLARERRRKADKSTFEYGAYFAYRWQDKDIPISYLPVTVDQPLTEASVMKRGYRAAAGDVWARLSLPFGRIEVEAAVLYGYYEQVSLLPGALLRDPSESIQWGVAVESDFGRPESAFGGGVDLGVASGDPAPGFGVRQTNPLATAAQPGDLDGPQVNPPLDTSANNFRFHPDYRVDRILFREIIGTVTDAVYIRPHVRYTLLDLGTSQFTLSLTGIASFALESASTPGGQAPLGVELDPTLAYRHKDGFGLSLEHGVLFPLAGLDNPQLNMPAKPAQMLRARATYTF
ncbi:MAG: TIGR04551 family protein [Polyangiaceae bacterium]|nr:TIGR04551 family protein [Polyangiaceae bacterium]